MRRRTFRNVIPGVLARIRQRADSACPSVSFFHIAHQCIDGIVQIHVLPGFYRKKALRILAILLRGRPGRIIFGIGEKMEILVFPNRGCCVNIQGKFHHPRRCFLIFWNYLRPEWSLACHWATGIGWFCSIRRHFLHIDRTANHRTAHLLQRCRRTSWCHMYRCNRSLTQHLSSAPKAPLLWYCLLRYIGFLWHFA